MGILKGPLLSFSASGKFGKAVTFARWKGIQTVREKSSPSHVITPAQAVHRGYVAEAGNAWTNSYDHQLDQQSYKTLAVTTREAPSGYTFFLTQTLAQRDEGIVPDMVQYVQLVGGVPALYIKLFSRLITTTAFAPIGRQGYFYKGTSLNDLQPFKAAVRGPGNYALIDTTSTPGDVYYVALRRNDYWLSGVYRITVV